MAQATSNASQRQLPPPRSFSPSSPRPNSTTGNAAPSLRPPSPVRLNRSRSRSDDPPPARPRPAPGPSAPGSRRAGSRRRATGPAGIAGRRQQSIVIAIEGNARRRGRCQPWSRKRHAELESDGEERDEQGDFRDPFQFDRVPRGVRRHQPCAGGTQGVTDREIENAGAQRQPLEQRAEQCHGDQDGAGDQRPHGEKHRGVPVSAGRDRVAAAFSGKRGAADSGLPRRGSLVLRSRVVTPAAARRATSARRARAGAPATRRSTPRWRASHPAECAQGPPLACASPARTPRRRSALPAACEAGLHPARRLRDRVDQRRGVLVADRATHDDVRRQHLLAVVGAVPLVVEVLTTVPSRFRPP